MIVAVGCAASFSLGLYAVLTRREIIGILVGAELMLGAANVQLVALGAAGDGVGASAFGLLVLVVAAAEASIGLALVVTAFRRSKRTRVDEFREVAG
ncbi:MAG: NADH-quinone oxidoreductase subunit NuoK [Coriobacteriia bacterium]|nr:NADH-quinone oxidoreductase subunit NuoK [Coriobacteriia bacterium]